MNGRKNYTSKNVPLRSAGFTFTEVNVGIDDCPKGYRDVIENPEDHSDDDYEAVSRLMEEWKTNGNFVFYWNNDYTLDHDGHVVAS